MAKEPVVFDRQSNAFAFQVATKALHDRHSPLQGASRLRGNGEVMC